MSVDLYIFCLSPESGMLLSEQAGLLAGPTRKPSHSPWRIVVFNPDR